MRRVTCAMGSVLVLGAAAGCFRSAPGATQGQLYRRAEIDLACPAPQIRHFDLDHRARLVQGCGKQVVYVESCEPIRGDFRCTWLADSPALSAGPVSFVIPAVPAGWGTAAAEPATPPAPDAPRDPPSLGELPSTDVEKAPRPSGHGFLSVASVGGYCSVAIDGRALGATPVAGIRLPEGDTQVTCETPGRTVRQNVRIEPGRTARLRFDLERPASTRLDWGF